MSSLTAISTDGWEHGYDSVTWDKMPDGPWHFVYRDGKYAAPAPAYPVLERQGKVGTICVYSGTVANEYDYEPGNENDPVTWARNMRRAYEYLGVVYCAESNAQTVLDLFETAGIEAPYFSLADWTGRPPATVNDYGAGTVSIQYATSQYYDSRLVSPNYPAIGAPLTTTPAPPATLQEDTDMIIYHVEGETTVWALSGGLLWHVADEASLSAYNGKVPEFTVTPAEISNIQTAIAAARTAG
jgi:hypothetical protein